MYRGDDPALTRSGALVGTPRYMSPEQAAAAKQPVDHRTDVYSLGATLYELLTRRPAFDGPTPLDVVMQILERTPVPPRALDPAVPRDLETIVGKAMAKRPADRYQSAADLADDLRRWREDRPIRARRIGVAGRLVRWARREPKVATLAGVVFLLLCLLQVLNTVSSARVRRERDRARNQEAKAVAAREETDRALAASLVNQARVTLASDRPGRRWLALDLIRQAVDRGAGRGAGAGPSRAELRGLAAEALALRDLRTDRELPGLTFAVSADGRTLARVAYDGEEMALRVGPADGGPEREVTRWRLDGDFLPALALAPDGRLLAVASGIGPPGVTVWDWAAGTKRVLPDLPEFGPDPGGWPSACQRLSFGPGGRHLAALRVVGATTQLVLWDVRAGGPPAVPEPMAIPGPFAFSPDGRRLAAPSTHGLLLHALDGPGPAALWPDPAGAVKWLPGPLAFAPDGPLLASTHRATNLQPFIALRDAATGRERRRITLPGGYFTHLSFSPDGARLAAAAYSDERETVHYFRVADGAEELRHPAPPGGLLRFLQWHADGRRLLSAVETQAVRLWEPAWTGAGTELASGHPVPTEFAFSPDGRRLAVGGWAGPKEGGRLLVRLADRRGGPARELPAPDTHYRLFFRPDGRQLAAVARKLAVVWDADAGRELARREAPPGAEFAAGAFDPAGEPLAVLDRAPAGAVWNLRTGETVWELPPEVGSARLSPDGRWLVGGVGQGAARASVWDVATRRPARPLAPPAGGDELIDQPRFSPDGRWLFTLTPSALLTAHARPYERPRASVWDVATGAKRHDLGGDVFASCSAFSADGRLLAVGYEDGGVRVWRAEAGEELLRWKPHARQVRRLAFTPDGAELVSSDNASPDLPVLRLDVLRRELDALGLGW
jgi:WD40 repeat protein